MNDRFLQEQAVKSDYISHYIIPIITVIGDYIAIILSEKLIKTKALKQKRVMKLSEYKILINHKQQKLKTQALKEQYFFLLKLFRKI